MTTVSTYLYSKAHCGGQKDLILHTRVEGRGMQNAHLITFLLIFVKRLHGSQGSLLDKDFCSLQICANITTVQVATVLGW